MATVRWAVGRGHGAVVLHLRGSYDLDAAQNVDSTHTLQPVQHACIVGIIVCSCTCTMLAIACVLTTSTIGNRAVQLLKMFSMFQRLFILANPI